MSDKKDTHVKNKRESSPTVKVSLTEDLNKSHRLIHFDEFETTSTRVGTKSSQKNIEHQELKFERIPRKIIKSNETMLKLKH